MKRGAIVVVAARGPYTGKPRPAVVVQSDLFNPTHGAARRKWAPSKKACGAGWRWREGPRPGGRGAGGGRKPLCAHPRREKLDDSSQ
jgi:PemK-like, MazF-like toxin of type II toxin-antitoxin system